VLSSARWEGAWAVQDAVREFDCRRCGRRTCVCRPCDRGQEYCGENCAELSRQGYLRVARARYQKTRRGAHLHAARQRRYRARCAASAGARAKIVTDLGSAAACLVGTVVTHEQAAERTDDRVCARPAGAARRCDFCGATFPDPAPGVGGGEPGTASTDAALRAAAQTQPAGGTGAAGIAVGDRPATAGGGDRGEAELYPDRRLQAGAGDEAPGARHGACDVLADGGGRSAVAGAQPSQRPRGCAGPSLAARRVAGTLSMVARGVGAALREKQELGEWPARVIADLAGLDPGTNPRGQFKRARGDEVSGAARARQCRGSAVPGHGVGAVEADVATSRRAVLRLAGRHDTHARADRTEPADLPPSTGDSRGAPTLGDAALLAGSRRLGRHRASCSPYPRGPPTRRVTGKRTERSHHRVGGGGRRGATTGPKARANGEVQRLVQRFEREIRPC
jgi:hypothetical protein